MKFLGFFGAIALAFLAVALFVRPLQLAFGLDAAEAGFIVGLGAVSALPLILGLVRRGAGALAAFAFALVLAGCQTPQTSSTGWSQIAAGVGAVIGETKIDPQIEKVSSKLASYCTELKLAALAVDTFAPERLQQAAYDGRIALVTFCASPPRNVAQAIASIAAAYAAIEAARSRA